MAPHSRSAPLLLLLLILLSNPRVSTWFDPFFFTADPSSMVVTSGPVLFAHAQKSGFSLFSRSKPDVKLDDQESIKKQKKVLEALKDISSLEKSKKDHQDKKAKTTDGSKDNKKQDKEVVDAWVEGKEGDKEKDKAENKSAKKLLAKRKGVDALLEAVTAESPPSQMPPPTAESDDKSVKDKDEKAGVNTDGDKVQEDNKQESVKEAPKEADKVATKDATKDATKETTKEKTKEKTKEATKETTKKKKKKTGHEDDIIHEHDHADNDAYDDIIWYDGPHSDDEDEHGDHHDDDDDDDHDDDHDDDYDDDHDEDHHDEDHDEDEDDSSETPKKRAPNQVVLKTDPGVLSNLQKISGTKPKPKSKSKVDDASNPPPSSEHNHDDAHDGPPGAFHHSGADAIQGSISPTEFCLRLKHECESTCREFRAGVLHIPTTCETGSVAELLFWGKCCQIGQEHRVNSPSSKANKSKKKTQGQSGQSKQQEKQGQQQALHGQPQEDQKQGEQENDLAQQYLKRQQKRHEAKRAAEAEAKKSTS